MMFTVTNFVKWTCSGRECSSCHPSNVQEEYCEQFAVGVGVPGGSTISLNQEEMGSGCAVTDSVSLRHSSQSLDARLVVTEMVVIAGLCLVD